jgi:hypothetical protein
MTITAARLAMLAVMRADAGFLAWLGLGAGEDADSRIFFGTAPDNARFPRITIDSPTNSAQNLVGFDGWSGSELIHCWTEGRDESLAVIGWEHFQRMFKVPIPVTEHEFLGGEMELMGTMKDPVIEAVQAYGRYIHWLIEP